MQAYDRYIWWILVDMPQAYGNALMTNPQKSVESGQQKHGSYTIGVMGVSIRVL